MKNNISCRRPELEKSNLRKKIHLFEIITCKNESSYMHDHINECSTFQNKGTLEQLYLFSAIKALVSPYAKTSIQIAESNI